MNQQKPQNHDLFPQNQTSQQPLQLTCASDGRVLDIFDNLQAAHPKRPLVSIAATPVLVTVGMAVYTSTKDSGSRAASQVCAQMQYAQLQPA